MTQNTSDAEFRTMVRDFVARSLPSEMAERGRSGFTTTREDMSAWQRILNAKGWGAPSWAPAHGGPGWTAAQRLIFEEECFAAGAPAANPQGLTMLGPVLNRYGTPAQRERFLPGILNGDTIWCQGFSEPGAGSDLASLKTRATLDGGHYVVSGQKAWTSHAHFADWVFLLVRTEPAGAKKQAGISFVLADMRTPGISVRPVISIDDEHHLNDTFYDNVRVPVGNRVGAEGQGWEIAKFLLTQERVFGAADLPGLKAMSKRLKALASQPWCRGAAAIDDKSFAQELALCEIALAGLEHSVRNATSTGAAPGRWDAVVGPMIKQRSSELHQTMSTLLMRAIGDRGAVRYDQTDLPTLTGGDAVAAGCAADYFYKRAATIFGGTREIQYDIIAKELLQR